MWTDSTAFQIGAALAPAFPALAALFLGTLAVFQRRPKELAIVTITHIALWLSLASVALGCAGSLYLGRKPIEIQLGSIYQSGDYSLELRILYDEVSVAVATVASVLLLATSRFAQRYLHREPGFLRFFVLNLTFSAGLLLLVLGGSYDLLLAGWEVVGWTSVLLVAFFHERTGPVRAGLRVLVTYRVCDIGLLLGAVWLHLTLHTTAFHEISAHLGGAAPAAALGPIGLCLIFAAMGKSAQFPVGGWLPRAMEGPTASSAVFYGGLSVHAGVYLLIRAEPLFAQAPASRVALIAVGTITAVMAALSGQTSADAKSSLAYATISQVGLMFVECGLGLPRLALFHLCAHAVLRYYQFLRTPSALQDALARRVATGRASNLPSLSGASPVLVRQTPVFRNFLYRLAIERFSVETTLDRWLTRPVLHIGRWCAQFESSLIDRLHLDAADPERASGAEGGEGSHED